MIKKIALASVASMVLLTVAQAGETYGTVNGVSITEEDIASTIGQAGMSFKTLDPEMKKRVLDMVIDRKLLTEVAQKSGVENTDEYKTQLESMKKDLALDLFMRKEMKTLEASFTKDKLQEEYKKNKKLYSTPKKLHARHILVTKEEEAKAIIKELDSAKDKKAKFIELAKTKSTGPSGQNGGDLGWFEPKMMVAEFSDAADKLKDGEYTKTPVKTRFGYHIIMLDGKKEASVKPFETVEEQIKNSLAGQAFAETMKKKTQELRKSAKIELKKTEEPAKSDLNKTQEPKETAKIELKK